MPLRFCSVSSKCHYGWLLCQGTMMVPCWETGLVQDFRSWVWRDCDILVRKSTSLTPGKMWDSEGITELEETTDSVCWGGGKSSGLELEVKLFPSNNLHWLSGILRTLRQRETVQWPWARHFLLLLWPIQGLRIPRTEHSLSHSLDSNYNYHAIVPARKGKKSALCWRPCFV